MVLLQRCLVATLLQRQARSEEPAGGPVPVRLRTVERSLVPVERARRAVLAACEPLAPVVTPLAEVCGLVLAEEVVASADIPPFPNSSMDGYALRAADVATAPVRLQVVGELMAGDDPAGVVVLPGQAVRIMTGAVMPAGADSVCMVEQTRQDGEGSVVVERPLGPGTNVRLPGDDISAGSVVFSPGTVLRPAHVGVLSSLGALTVKAFPQPRVGVLSTGDELVQGAGTLPPGKIRDSNRPALLAQLRSDGFCAVDLGWVGDDAGAVAALLASATDRCDAVVTSGGVSMGVRDVVRAVISSMAGARSEWMQVAVKPAKPFGFCLLPPRGTPLFGLPGNPVSALVSYELFARPALRRMAGRSDLLRPVVRARATADMPRRPDGKLHLVRAVLAVGAHGALEVSPSVGQGSHQLHSLSLSNSLVALPDGPGAHAGDPVDVWVTGELTGAALQG